MSIISLENVSIVFRQRRERMLLRDHLREMAQRMPKDGFYALHEVSFRVERGESLGIIGANGAGKSTLLSLLAGLTGPDKGVVRVAGKVGALLELGSGFHPDLTGRENLLMNAALLGLNEKAARERAQAIIDFSELGPFIDEPLRTYSSGMNMRLGFSVAVHAENDILLIDEILAVGDIAFQKKCMAHILGLRKAGKTLVCVSHVPGVLEELCDRLVWLHHGHLIHDGEFDVVSADYISFMADPHRQFGDEIPQGPRQVTLAPEREPRLRALAKRKRRA
jgi:ABC-type polysaccharide/polyol phosphate transport system ATPase subunit